jgi:endoglycosylceramidase
MRLGRVFSFIFCISSLTLTCASFADTPEATLLPVSHNGTKLVDSAGRQMVFHGLDVISKHAPYEPSAAGFSEKDVEFLQKQGFNLVRLGVMWSAIEPNAGQPYNDSYLANIKSTINLLAKHGIYTVIDFHQDGYSAKDNLGVGMPSWASLGKSPTANSFNPGFPLSYRGGTKVGQKVITMETDNNFSQFWADTRAPQKNMGLQTAYANMLTHTAAYFKGTKSIIGYEIMNEPFIGDNWKSCIAASKPNSGCQEFASTTLQMFSEKMSAAIHQGDPNTIAWMEPEVNFDLGENTYLNNANLPNSGFSFHDYNTDVSVPIAKAVQFQAKNNSPILMTEFGAATASDKQLSQITSLADSDNLSWSEWAYFNNPDFKFPSVNGHVIQNPISQGIVLHDDQPLTGSNVNWNRLKILTRPYPQAIAGSKVSFEFSPQKLSLNLHYISNAFTSDATSKVTIITVPGSIYNVADMTLNGAQLINHQGNILTFKNTSPGTPVSISLQLKQVLTPKN